MTYVLQTFFQKARMRCGMFHRIRGCAVTSKELTGETIRRLRLGRRYLYGQSGEGGAQPHLCGHLEKDTSAAENGARRG